MATFLYARVSTTEQTLEHQQAQAEAAGYTFDHVLADRGVSGINVLLRDRPEGGRLFDMLRANDVLVVRWIDRLGRNYSDVTDTVREFIRRGVIIKTVINGMTFDGTTKDPVQMAVRDALIGFMAATAQAQAEVTKEAQKAGIAAARAKARADKFMGRKPSYSRHDFNQVVDLLNKGLTVTQVAAETKLSRQIVYRIRDHREKAEAALTRWEPKE